MSKIIRIGTRDSELALWQANTVKNKLDALGHKTTLVLVKSTGDLLQTKPLYELGITGIFTRTLDTALLDGKIDIAVHSMKDVPTLLPKGIVQMAVLERANPSDILVHKGLDFLNTEGIVATGSLRRRAQWLHRYPLHEMAELRGNVNTRLRKFKENAWDGAIFAAAGLERINLLPENYTELQWMIPAPAQGAMLIVGLEDDIECQNALKTLNHDQTEICASMERDFLRTLEGGCSAPIGALAKISKDEIQFKGCLHSLDGQQKVEVQKSLPLEHSEGLGRNCAHEVLESGGQEIMKGIKSQMQK